MSIEPIFDPLGQVGSLSLPIPICPGVQACSPSAEDGLTDMPSGSVTTACFRFAVASPSGLSFCGIVRSTPIPAGAPRFAALSGRTTKPGWNASSSQFLAKNGWPSKSVSNDADFTSLGCCHEFAVILVTRLLSLHDVGAVMNGFRVSVLGIPTAPPNGSGFTRSESWLGSAGTPRASAVCSPLGVTGRSL